MRATQAQRVGTRFVVLAPKDESLLGNLRRARLGWGGSR